MHFEYIFIPLGHLHYAAVLHSRSENSIEFPIFIVGISALLEGWSK